MEVYVYNASDDDALMTSINEGQRVGVQICTLQHSTLL